MPSLMISYTDCKVRIHLLQLVFTPLKLHDSHSKKDVVLWSQRWWKMVLDTHPPRSPWSHWVWVMIPTHIQISILIHGFIDRSIGHGRYRRSIGLHSRKNTVDIDVDRITLTEEYGWYRRSIGLHSLQIAVDRGSRIKYRDNLWSILSTTPVQICLIIDRTHAHRVIVSFSHKSISVGVCCLNRVAFLQVPLGILWAVSQVSLAYFITYFWWKYQ